VPDKSNEAGRTSEMKTAGKEMISAVN
jgi:hypothetical protein